MTKKVLSTGRQASLSAARAAFLDGRQLPATLLAPAVASSWERSRSAGLRPNDAPEYEPLSRTRSRRDTRDDRRLYSCVADEIDVLWEAFGGNDWSIFCVNAQGTIIHARKSAWCNDSVLNPITAGRRMLETQVGTTAPSCVLHDATQVVVRGSEHYLSEFADVFCLAVPLYGVQGEVIGALDITGKGQRDVAQVGEQFQLASLGAEQRMFGTLRSCHLLRMHRDPRWLATPLAGMLAIDDDGAVRAISRSARRLLGVPQATALTVNSLESLFSLTSPALARRLLAPKGAPQRLVLADGSHVWVQHDRRPVGGGQVADAEMSAAALMSTPAPVVSPVAASAGEAGDVPLRERALGAVGEAVRRHGGNIAAAARELGISRTTLYAKLQLLKRAGMR